ncbi:MAG: flagellar biosynthetic protein FliR [Oscillospiraceae bacterium]|nr:flagellar biosynthetic protein FliR [Oscillospiraceae bacterium]
MDIYLDLTSALAFILVMLRMTGMMVFNPILGRANIPTQLSVGFAFILAILLTTTRSFPALPDPNLGNLIFMAVSEMLIGMAAGIIIRAISSALIIAGELIDMQMGIAMAKIFDPGTNASIALTANMFNIMFIFTFFITNNHLTFIYMVAQTFDIIPLGTLGISPAALYYLPNLISTVLLFAVKLALPIVVVELIVTMAVGVMMRIVPQISVFVVSIQLRLMIGIFALIVLVGPFMAFMENLWMVSFEHVIEIWRLMFMFD